MKAIAKENKKPSRRSTPFLTGKEGGGLFGVQTKLTVGETGDIYEREADFLADRAVSQHPVQGKLRQRKKWKNPFRCSPWKMKREKSFKKKHSRRKRSRFRCKREMGTRPTSRPFRRVSKPIYIIAREEVLHSRQAHGHRWNRPLAPISGMFAYTPIPPRCR